MKKIIISEDNLAKVCASIVANENAEAIVTEVGLIFLAKLGATLFDGVEDDVLTEVVCKKRRNA